MNYRCDPAVVKVVVKRVRTLKSIVWCALHYKRNRPQYVVHTGGVSSLPIEVVVTVVFVFVVTVMPHGRSSTKKSRL